MFGKGSGWGLIESMYALAVVLGGIGRRPALVDGALVEREMLSVTLSFDHAVVDGAPVARFASRFKELVESCYGLPDEVEQG